MNLNTVPTKGNLMSKADIGIWRYHLPLFDFGGEIMLCDSNKGKRI